MNLIDIKTLNQSWINIYKISVASCILSIMCWTLQYYMKIYFTKFLIFVDCSLSRANFMLFRAPKYFWNCLFVFIKKNVWWLNLKIINYSWFYIIFKFLWSISEISRVWFQWNFIKKQLTQCENLQIEIVCGIPKKFNRQKLYPSIKIALSVKSFCKQQTSYVTLNLISLW